MARARTKIKPPVAAQRAGGLEDILRRLEARGRVYDEDLLRSVYEFSEEMHAGQRRRSGEPYFTHPVNVAWLLADLHFDHLCVAVGLLHDVLEDTLTTREVLAERFGEEIAELVDGVTKIGRHEYVRRDEAQAETFRKMILASAKDVRVVLVKLADRLHNMQTLEHLPPEARRRISRETLEIYAPLAHRLGMSRVKGDLEDLAFFYLYPLQFSELHSKIQQEIKVGQGTIRRIRERLVEALDQAGIEAEITFRVKRYYSIYQKLRRQGIDISQLYDYLAFRIITERERDTYAALGIVHQTWRPIMGRFKDYIADAQAERLPVAPHHRGGRAGPARSRCRSAPARWTWSPRRGSPPTGSTRRATPPTAGRATPTSSGCASSSSSQDVHDPRTFMTTLKIDLYPDEVYVFTPKGAVFAFPRGATPLDFAYKVHTEVGHHCAGARVNGRLVPLRTELSNGDMVEILTNPSRNPSRDWLGFVVTSRAKAKIRGWLNTEQKKRAVEIGRRLLEKEARRYGTSAKKVLERPELVALLESDGIPGDEELLSRIGFGKLEARKLLERVLPGGEVTEPGEETAGGKLRDAMTRILPFRSTPGPIVVKGHDDLLAYLAKCCNPLPGDDIVGFVTRGRGVSVHSVDCPNVQNLLYHPEREIAVEWGRARDRSDSYRIALVVETQDRPGMLARLAEAIASQESNIAQIEAETVESGRGLIDVTLQVRDRKHLERILRRVRTLPGVLRVDRRMSGSHLGSEAG